MPSLKEIKGRIASVKSTKKITSAMKMIASAKLRKAQSQIEQYLPYEDRLTAILNDFLAGYGEENFSSIFSEVREVQRVAIVVLSSNSSLCGAFNSNIIRILNETIQKYRSLKCEIEIYSIGKKVEDAGREMENPVEIKGSYIPLMDKPDYEGAKEIVESLMNDFLAKKIDRVDLIYNHFKNTAVQILMNEQFLPVNLSNQNGAKVYATDYIIEPDRQTLLELLIPHSLRGKIYAILLDSAAAENGARVVAMQIATDNADELLDDLTIQYNKQRQQAITSEILDLIGGSEALK